MQILGNIRMYKFLAKNKFSAKIQKKRENQIRNTQMSGRLTALAIYSPGGWTSVFEIVFVGEYRNARTLGKV